MLRFAKSWWVLWPCFVLVGSGASIQGNDKKKEEPQPLLKQADELKTTDEKDTKLVKSPRKTYAIKLTEGKTYQLNLGSKYFDTFLRLEDAAGKEVAFNDDDGSTFDSHIVYKAAVTGDYKIIVTSADGKFGKFNLLVIEADKKALPQTGSRFKGKPSELKTPVHGELNENDPTALHRYYKIYSVQLEKDKNYRLETRADDPKRPHGQPLPRRRRRNPARVGRLQQEGRSPGARIVHKAAKTGTYRVIVTTRPMLQTGKFVLEIAPIVR